MQSPMISAPLKQTNEIEWVQPLKQYIRSSYGDDPERYTEECATLNRLRQDMRGAGKDSASGRDLLYRYYGQLELLDLRFPVDENHIKVSFTWFDAFTHKPTSQYSLAFEKASVIFNISAVLSCHAANQDRHEETGLKTAYHSFQASAGMFTYINENFLHAPSTDLSRETVKTLITITLAQAQEVFLEKQVTDGKKSALLAKLAAQATYLYNSAAEGAQENVNKGVFERVWLLLIQVKQYWMAAVAQYHQGLADDDANSHGTAIARLTVAVAQAKEAQKLANNFPSSVSDTSNLSAETGALLAEMTKKHLTACTEKLVELTKDNDFIYHQLVPAEAALQAIPKLPAAKAIPVNELYQGQDIQRIVGPDIFQRIVPLAVTESASLYDEEKAKLLRAEGERVETANDEMAASLDYLKLPGSLNILKGGLDHEVGVDPEFRRWCDELSGHQGFGPAFDQINAIKSGITKSLDDASRQLDMEESVCEKMRNKYGADWTQQPSSLLTSTLRGDLKSIRSSIEAASSSDSQLFEMFRQNKSDMEEMKMASEKDEVDILYQRAMINAGTARSGSQTSSNTALEGSLLDDLDDDSKRSVSEQIAAVEELVRKLNLVKRERQQVLKDLKEKVHNDDISNVLILNKKAVASQENQIFQAELEKFRPYQNRLTQSSHVQSSLIKELTRTFGELLSDKRVKSEQNKYESFSRQRGGVLKKYRTAHQAFSDLKSGLEKARTFYSDTRTNVDSLSSNVEGFVNNRRQEGSTMLKVVEASKAGQGDQDRNRLNDLMERMSMNNPAASPAPPNRPPIIQHTSSYQSQYGSVQSPPPAQYPQPAASQYAYQSMYPQTNTNGSSGHPGQSGYGSPGPAQLQYGSPGPAHYASPAPAQVPYNPSTFAPTSPPTQQQFYSPPPGAQGLTYQTGQNPPYPNMGSGSYMPPPPQGRPPQPGYGMQNAAYPTGSHSGQTPAQPQQQQPPQHSSQADPWAGLNAWK